MKHDMFELPAPGTKVPVLLTRVNLNPGFGLVELWVNMDDGRKHIYEQLREEIQIPKRKFYGSEGNPGDLCLVCISDTWHRARIVSTESESYNVFLIDQGRPHLATTETLAWGNSDSFLFPPEVESCILANVLSPDNDWPERATKYLKSLPGKKFKGLVQHVLMPDRTILLDIPIVSKHLCKLGSAKKVPGDEFKCFVLRCLDLPQGDGSDASDKMAEQNLNVSRHLKERERYFYPELLTGTFETVVVTEVIDPNNIFCKLHIFSKALTLLSQEIHRHYEESSDFEEAQPPVTCGHPCAAKGINGRWHRSLLKQTPETSDGAVEVLHVDKGTTVAVPVGDIRPLHGKFLRMPVITYHCSLDGVKDDGTGWTTDQTDCLKSLLLNRTLMAMFDHYNIPQDVYSVTLYAANAACLNDCFIEETGLLPRSRDKRDSDLQKAPFPPAFPSSLEVEQHVTSESSVNADYVPKEMLSCSNNADDAPPSAADGIHINESSQLSDALSHNGHLSAAVSYSYSTHDIEVGEREKVWVTSAENVNHFHCQLKRNSKLFQKVIANINQFVAQPQYIDHPLVLDGVCFARYSDDQWYRGQIVEVSPSLRVHFVDYGETLAVNESDIRPFPAEACVARSVPVLALPLGLFDVSGDVPQEVNQWFARHAVDRILTISVVAKGTKGKLLVEMFDGTLAINVKVKEMMTWQTMKFLDQPPDHKLSNGSEPSCLPDEGFYNEQVLMNGTEENKICAAEKLKTSPKSISIPASVTEYGEHFDEDGEPALETVVTETFIQGGHSESEATQPSPLPHAEGNLNAFKRPDISPDQTQEVYSSCIVEPHYFWCQYANTEELNKVSTLAQEAGRAPQDMTFPETLGPGSPCVALFSGDNQWYRAQVLQKNADALHVLFVDYGNESDVDVKDVRSLPLSLLEVAPQAFLCSLNGFDGSKGSWDDQVYDDFYNLLVDKPLRVTMLNVEDHAEIAVPQCAVELECEGVVVNTLMEKYWKPVATEQLTMESLQPENMSQSGEAESSMTHPEEKIYTCMYNRPKTFSTSAEEVYASCIGDPHFFWCQYANTEDISKVATLAQEAGQAQQDTKGTDTLGPGSPCLALFASDNQWYRAQVLQSGGDTFHVLFVDFGNESDVSLNNVRSLPVSLLEVAPQAFLCTLDGFDESKGSWDDRVYDDFYSLLVDKPLRVTVVKMEDHSEFAVPQYAVQLACENVMVNDAMQKYWKPATVERVMTENGQRENSLQRSRAEANTTLLNVSKENGSISIYKEPNLFENQMEVVYASCVAEPHFFWCQYANTEELNKVSTLAQEAGRAPQDMTFPETLGPGSPCVALFSGDNQWYRAQVLQKNADALHVLFVDYGNEADVDVKDVRSLPLSLLEVAPQAFLCSLNGFDGSKGSWDDQVYDDFYNLLVDKPLRVTMLNVEDHAEIAVPQCAVELECEGVVVNTLMEKYWNKLDTGHALADGFESVNQGARITDECLNDDLKSSKEH